METEDFAVFDDSVLNLLADDAGQPMELDWMLGSEPSGSETPASPPRARPRLAAAAAPALPNLSDVSRSLATPAALADVSAVSRSFAGERAAARGARRRRKPAGGNLRNASAVSHNLARVGAVPQCNQAHPPSAPAAPAPPVVADAIGAGVVAEAVPLAPARAVVETVASRAAHAAAVAEIDATLAPSPAAAPTPPPPPPAGPPAVDEKLLLRRARNREAAERMRRRRREEHDTLTRTVAELTARVSEVERELAAARGREEAKDAEIAALRSDNAALRAGAARPGMLAVAGKLMPQTAEAVAGGLREGP